MRTKKSALGVQRCCQLLRIPRSAIYKKPKGPNDTSAVDAAMIEIANQDSSIGYPRMSEELIRIGFDCKPKRARLAMKRLQIVVKRKRKRIRTTFAVPVSGANLCKEFALRKRNQLWAADITYIHTEGKLLYLAMILDVYSRKIVGHALSGHMKTSLVLDALQMALDDRRPEEGWIHHSDRGSQYASSEYRECVLASGGLSSFSQVHKPSDNAYAESFFKTLKTEEVYKNEYETVRDAQLGIERFINYYNTRRLHSGIGYPSPEEFETDKLIKTPA